MPPLHPRPGSGGTGVLPGRGPRIEVVSALGRGRTLISSFDDALQRCGVPDYNLIDLSSIVPPSSTVVATRRCRRPADEYGHRLYVVRAEARSERPGTIVAAGVGWTQWGDGRGVFVEHARQTPDGTPEAVVSALVDHLHLALQDLCAARAVEYSPDRVCTRVEVGRVTERPTTALVLAVFQAEAWR
jgi:arginine decarboxylase